MGTSWTERLDAQLRSTLRITDSDLDEEPMEICSKKENSSSTPSQEETATASGGAINDAIDGGTAIDVDDPSSPEQDTVPEDVAKLPILADSQQDPGASSVAAEVKTPAGMLKEVIWLAIPTSATYTLIFVNQTVTLMFVGHQLGVEKLAAFALGQSVYNVLGLSISLGFAGAIDTFAAQAFGRDPKGSAVAKETQRGWYICLLLCLPLILILLSCEPLVSALFGAKLAPSIMEYLRAAPYPLLITTTNVCLTRAFQAQRLAEVTVRATLASACVCPLLNYFLTHHGISYAVIAYGLSLQLECCMLIYQGLTNKKAVIFSCTYPLSDDQVLSWQSIKTFLRLGVPMFFACASEWWAFEVQYVVVSQLSHAEIAAFNICLNMLVIAISIPIGNSCAGATFTGNCLGAGLPKLAKVYIKLIAFLGFVLSLLMALLLATLGPLLVHLYTTDPDTIAELASLAPFMALCHLTDGNQSTLQGTFRGAGKQDAMAKAFLVCLWLVETPLSAFLALKTPLHLRGIMIGFAVGYAIAWPWMLRTVNSWSFRDLAIEAAERAATTDKVDEMEAQELDELSTSTYHTPPSSGLTSSFPTFPNILLGAHPINDDRIIHNLAQHRRTLMKQRALTPTHRNVSRLPADMPFVVATADDDHGMGAPAHTDDVAIKRRHKWLHD